MEEGGGGEILSIRSLVKIPSDNNGTGGSSHALPEKNQNWKLDPLTVDVFSAVEFFSSFSQYS